MFQQNQKQLASYLTAGLGAGCLAATADAAIISLDVSSVSGSRTATDSGARFNWDVAGNTLYVDAYEDRALANVGLAAYWDGDLNLAMTAGNDGLFKFATGAIIGSGANWASDDNSLSLFNYDGTKQPGGNFSFR